MKTYEFGLIQTAAFRGLKAHTLKRLKPYSLTTYEWATLGIIFEAKSEGCRITYLADTLHVSKPFISKTISGLTKKGWVKRSDHSDTDKRSVRIVLTKKGKTNIPKIEKTLRESYRKVFGGINKVKLVLYVDMLKQISNTLEADIKDGPLST